MSGQIVVISGTSGSGKTTTVQTFARRARDCYLMLGLDVLVGTMYPAKFTLFGEQRRDGYYDFHEDPNNPGKPLSTEYFGPVGWQTVRALHEMIAAAARSGQNMVIDHLALARHGKDEAAFAELPHLLALAKRPNVAAKASALPRYSSEAYPYPKLHPYLRQVFDAFGPQRMFWGTDITRMPCSWRQCVTMFTEELPWLEGRDLELVMGRAVCDWIGWKLSG